MSEFQENSWWFRNVTRPYLEYQVRMGDRARYRLEDPAGFFADKAVTTAESLVLPTHKKALDGKELSARRLGALSTVSLSLAIIIEKGHGRQLSRAEELIGMCDEIFQNQASVVSAGIEDLMTSYDEDKAEQGATVIPMPTEPTPVL